MAASGNTLLELEIGDRNEAPVAAGKNLYRGSLAFGDIAGRAAPELSKNFLGHVAIQADNSSGGAGAINVLLHAGRYRAQVTLAGVALTDIGARVYASDNNTLALTSNGGANTLVGQVARYVAANTAVVEFMPATAEQALDVPQAHIADAKANYVLDDLAAISALVATKEDYANTDVETGGNPDTAKMATILNTIAGALNDLQAALQAGDLPTVINTVAGKINAVLASDEGAGIRAAA